MSGPVALLVALGGALGAVLRFVVDGELKALLARTRASGLPVSTFVINLAGSFALGLVAGTHPGAHIAAFVLTGICGGFTTFSTASVESITLARTRGGAPAALHAVVMFCACLAAVWLGASLSG